MARGLVLRRGASQQVKPQRDVAPDRSLAHSNGQLLWSSVRGGDKYRRFPHEYIIDMSQPPRRSRGSTAEAARVVVVMRSD